MCRVQVVFLDQQEVFTRQNRFHGPNFKTTRGNTQDGLISPTLFNLMVDNVVLNWLALMLEDPLVTQEGLGLVLWRCLGLLYAGNIMVVLLDP